MTRPLAIPLALVPILALVLVVAWPSATGTGPAPAAAQDLMKCMEQCIRHEGGNSAENKATCKTRCAQVPSAGGGYGRPGGGGNCMAVYKDCQAGCAKDRKCQRACKSALMRCK